ncbi:FAD-dependent thymidylate synthase [Myxococcota bacterium]
MREIDEPAVYLVAKTSLVSEGLSAFLTDIGDPEWRPDPTAAEAETLLEAAGRLCYRSWQPYDSGKPTATNPNVTKVRTGNAPFLRNIIESGHGSVLEHAAMTFICRGISRVFTHELVRHRAGMAYSQESLRYVRLDDLPFWLPGAVVNNPRATKKFRDVLEFLEIVQRELASMFQIDDAKDFNERKRLTSMFRRLAPIGLGTSIMVTGNLRAWRHVIATRTSPAAEEEIRIVVGKIATICKREYPHVFFDISRDDETGEWRPLNPKV